jgi:hypothetical protein
VHRLAVNLSGNKARPGTSSYMHAGGLLAGVQMCVHQAPVYKPALGWFIAVDFIHGHTTTHQSWAANRYVCFMQVDSWLLLTASSPEAASWPAW